MGRGGVRKAVCGAFDLLGTLDQLLARGRDGIAGLAFLEQRDAERGFERGDPARDGRLAGAQTLSGGERAALAGDREKIAKIVPVEHRGGA